jgi:hypothetical protein
MSLMRENPNAIGQSARHDHLAPVPLKSLEKISFFKKTGNLVLYKKSERIAAAVFVVSDGISSDTLRERVRGEALAVFSGVRDAIMGHGSILPATANALALAVTSLVSVMELAARIGEVTESNYALIRQECVRLAEALIEAASGVADALDPSIFDTGVPEAAEAAPRREVPAHPPNPRVLYKGHVKDTKPAPAPQMSFRGSARDFAASLQSSIEDREAKIIEVVRKLGRVSIKDISDAMPGVGEKTVQRALVSLVTRGVLKKEGERRWSRYALAQATLAV